MNFSVSNISLTVSNVSLTGLNRHYYSAEEIKSYCIQYANSLPEVKISFLIHLLLLFWGIYQITILMIDRDNKDFMWYGLLILSTLSVTLGISHFFI